MKERRLNEIKGIVLIACGLIILASLLRFERLDSIFYTSHPNVPPHNLLGIFGAYLGGILVFLLGRIPSFFIPFFILLLGIKYFRQQQPNLRHARILGFVLLLVSISSLIGVLPIRNEAVRFYQSGLLGFTIANFITTYSSRLFGYIILIALALLSFSLVAEILIYSFFLSALNRLKSIFRPILKFRLRPKTTTLKPASAQKKESLRGIFSPLAKPKITLAKQDLTEQPPNAMVPVMPKIQIKPKQSGIEPAHKIQEQKTEDYQLPSLDLLEVPPPLEERQIKEDLTANARILEETLDDFGISAKVTDIERGPIITRYELEPAPGVKLNRIVALSDDIALTMKAQSVRIVAPIPGKGRVGVEVPNIQSSFVYLKEVLASAEFQKEKSKLTLAVGKDIAGQPVIADLDEMPHLLIAGTTGSGKTVCVNSLILSMLYKAAPHELKFLMIDPKMVELASFNGLPHLLCPAVTDAKKAAVALGWVVNEMENRYHLLAKEGVRNIEAYNAKQEKIPYIVVIIDELADLMAIARDQIESAITRLAQLSRAVGIHLILATQRPSVDVITGVIKANFPARISFKVPSKVDSRTVLDMNGADKLLGRGDMLILRPQEAKLTRAQGALVTDREIERVADFIRSQAEPVYDEEILKGQQKSHLTDGEKDEYYDEAVRVIMESGQASVSILQRRLRLGYTRAARIIDMMENEGLIGPFEGSKPRRILIDREAWIEKEVLPQEDKE